MSYYRTLRRSPAFEELRNQYPIGTIAIAIVLIFLAPFTSSLLSWLALVFCVYRVIRFSPMIFATDYCLLLPLASIFRSLDGMGLMVYLCLFATGWYLIVGQLRAYGVYLLLLVLLGYLILRMQMDFARLLLCFGQITMLCVLLPLQNAQSAERSVKAFCISVLVTSIYALIFRNTDQLTAVRGKEAVAIWGTSLMRFQGLYRDPNYYMTMLVTGLAILIKLNGTGRLGVIPFAVAASMMGLFGILTYSKTFFIMLVLLVLIYVAWQFGNRRYVRGIFLVLAGILAGSLLLFGEDSIIQPILERFANGKNLSDFTTGRTDILIRYFEKIISTASGVFFGQGMAADGLYRDPHNLFIEIIYFIGLTGMGLILGIYYAVVRIIKRKNIHLWKGSFAVRYIVLAMVVLAYLTLHGMYELVSYGELFLALLTLFIVQKDNVLLPLSEEER